MVRHKHEHVARLYRAIASCGWDGCFKKDGWQKVLYPLQMAASLEDVYADMAYARAADGQGRGDNEGDKPQTGLKPHSLS